MNINKLFRFVAFLCVCIIGFITFNLGMDWINLDHGLHPVIAFPIATICCFVAVILFHWTELMSILELDIDKG